MQEKEDKQEDQRENIARKVKIWYNEGGPKEGFCGEIPEIWGERDVLPER